MAILSDERFNALRLLGYTGSTSDMMILWLLDRGATSKCISDAWAQVLELINPGAPGQRTDRWNSWLKANGYNVLGANTTDMEALFWANGGELVPYTNTRAFSNGFSEGFG